MHISISDRKNFILIIFTKPKNSDSILFKIDTNPNFIVISNEKTVILVTILIGIAAFTGMTTFIDQGNVRHVSFFWQERFEQTVAFEDVCGDVQLRGISGIGWDPNP